MEAVREAAGRSCVEDVVPAVVEELKVGVVGERGDKLEAVLEVGEVPPGRERGKDGG